MRRRPTGSSARSDVSEARLQQGKGAPGLAVPLAPGACTRGNGVLVSCFLRRVGHARADVWPDRSVFDPGRLTRGAPMKPDNLAEELRAQILGLVAQYADVAHAPQAFEPGRTPIPVSGKVLGAPELKNLVEASLDGWLTT